MIKNIYNKIIKMNFEKNTFKNYLKVKAILKKLFSSNVFRNFSFSKS